MGYTHYWDFKKPISIKGKHIKIEKQYQLALKQCYKIIELYQSETTKGSDNRLSGYSSHCKYGDYPGIEFNGSRGNDHETFSFRDHYTNATGDFCKTARKPYDIVVVACLITMKRYLGDLFQFESDGDYNDLLDGLELAKRALGLKSLSIPNSIRRTMKLVEVS